MTCPISVAPRSWAIRLVTARTFSRISSAVAVHRNGFGSVFQSAAKRLIAWLRTLADEKDRRDLALGGGHHRRVGPDQRPAPGTLTSANPSLQPRKNAPRRGTPGTRPRQPGHCHTANLELRSAAPPSGMRQPAIN